MPWSYPGNVPAVAQNWTEEQQRRCVEAANRVLEETGDEERAIFACIAAAGKETAGMERKVFQAPMRFKEGGEPGEFTAVFATMNVVDHDRDVTLPGAFTEGEAVRIGHWNHAWSELPVGRGAIHEQAEKAIVDGRFFLDTEAGKEHYRTVKNLGDLQEWSYGFDIIDSSQGEFEGQKVRFLKKLKVHEVSPVMLGAGIGTHTADIKGVKAALAAHSTATTDAAWDGPANEARARSGEDEAYYRRIYAWRDPDGDPTVKASYRFIHHMVGGGGEPGAANVRACVTGIAVLNGARGGTAIPDGDRRGVWNHLARHLRDADVEPPELKAASPKALQVLRAYLSEFDAASGGDGQTSDQTREGVSSGEPQRIAAQMALDVIEFCE